MLKRIFLLLTISLSTLSCAQDEDSDLSFSFTNSRAALISGTASSCTQLVQSVSTGTAATKDIAAKYFSLIAPKLSYKGTGKVLIFSIRITMNSSGLQGGTFRCEISGDELGWTFGVASTAWDGIMTAGSTLANNALCPNLKCGGVNALANTAFTATGQIVVEGSEIDANGEENPIRATANISIENRPL